MQCGAYLEHKEFYFFRIYPKGQEKFMKENILSIAFVLIFSIIAIKTGYYNFFNTKKVVMKIAKRTKRKSAQREYILSKFYFCLAKVLSFLFFIGAIALLIYVITLFIRNDW